MIVYNLSCEVGHEFEGWFQRADDYARQKAEGSLSCPVCGSGNVEKRPTASHINTHSSQNDRQNAMAEMSPKAKAAAAAIQELHRYVDQHYSDVGADFPEEARKIHYRECEARNIRGTATPDEASALYEEGIEVYSLPPKPVEKEKLN